MVAAMRIGWRWRLAASLWESRARYAAATRLSAQAHAASAPNAAQARDAANGEALNLKLPYPNLRLSLLSRSPLCILPLGKPSCRGERWDLERFTTRSHLPEWTREVGWLQFVTRYFPG